MKYPWFTVGKETQKWFLVKTNTIYNLISPSSTSFRSPEQIPNLSNLLADFLVLMVLSGILNSEESDAEFHDTPYWRIMISSFVARSVFDESTDWFVDLRYTMLRSFHPSPLVNSMSS